MTKHKIYAIIMAAALLVVDQLSKLAVLQWLPRPPETVTAVPFLFNFFYIENTGAAFGMMSDKPWIFMTLTVVFLVAAVIALIKYPFKSKLVIYALLLIISGGIGNMIDRICRHFVVDFIQFAFFTAFPVFNIADCCVVIGCCMLVLYLIVDILRDKRKAEHGQA